MEIYDELKKRVYKVLRVVGVVFLTAYILILIHLLS